MKKLSKEAILLIVFVLIFTLLSIMSPGKFLTGAICAPSVSRFRNSACLPSP